MGMGYGANYADVIEDKDVQKLCPKEYKAFDNAIDDNEGYELEAVAREITFEGMESIVPKIKKAYIALTKAFNKKTGLELGIGFHDADESGDRYDEVNGAYWNVGGVFTRTPAGKKYKALIDRKFYVTFG